MPEVSTLESIVKLADEFGPFLFAILFILVVPKTAHGYYERVSERKHPAATAEEKRAYRLYFLSSVWCGVVVMFLSIGWWFWERSEGQFLYQIAITGLGQDEIVAGEYFSRDAPRQIIPGTAPIHDVFFLIARTQPFQMGEKFAFEYYSMPQVAAGGGIAGDIAAQPLQVAYDGRALDRFALKASPGGAPSLVLIAGNAMPGGAPLREASR